MEQTIHAGHNHGFLGEWIESLIGIFNLEPRLAECINHILVDSINVFFLLIVVMFVVFMATGYINLTKLQKKLSTLKSLWGMLLAGFLGILSPFCSCSIIPVLMGFLSMGVPISVCLCFLTASSMINITALLSLYATAGAEFATIYIISSVVIIAVSSFILLMLKLDLDVGDYHHHQHSQHGEHEPMKSHIRSAWECTVNVLKRSSLFILIGVILSSAVMTYLPIDALSNAVESNSFLSTVLMSVVGIPIHSDIFSISPIIQLLKQLSVSLAISFTLSTMAISLPSVIILSRAIKPRATAWYCTVIVAVTIIVGLVLSLIF